MVSAVIREIVLEGVNAQKNLGVIGSGIHKEWWTHTSVGVGQTIPLALI